MIAMLAIPMLACVALIGIHVYFGGIVLRRGIIFIDLALAQWAGLGVLVGHWVGIESPMALFLMGFLGTLIAAALLIGISPSINQRHGQEAVIGVVYVVAIAMAMALISSSGLDGHHLSHMLSGHLLFVSPMEVAAAIALYISIGLILPGIHHRLVVPQSRRWQFIFYALFGLVVTSSVKMVGILLVFSLLVIPSLSAALWTLSFKRQLILGWGIGIAGAIIGMISAIRLDIPLSLSIVLAITAIFVGCLFTHPRH
jgi:zinc/manganese transport system permease protein